MSVGFDLSRGQLAELFFETAKQEVAKICRDKAIDEHRAMEVATDCILRLLPKATGVRLAENFARKAIHRDLKRELGKGKLKFGSDGAGESLEAGEIDYVDADANSDIEALEMAEFLATVTTAEERDLLATRGEGLSHTEEMRLSRLRKRLEGEFAA